MLPRGEEGKISLVVPVFLLLAAGVVYGLAFYLPPWGRNREVVAALREAAYQGWRVDDPHLRRMVRDKTDRIWVIDENGTDRPLLGNEDIQIDRTADRISLSVSYSVQAVWPFTEQSQVVSFDDDVSASLENPFKEKKSSNGFFSFLGLE